MTRSPRLAVLLALWAGLMSLTGCTTMGWLANGVAGDTPPVNVKAEYRGLENQTVAVLVDADTNTLFQHPLAQLEVATALADAIAANTPGVTVRNPRQTVEFQRRNIYWNTMTWSELAQRLGVSRLVVVELIDYRTHEPGNENLWQGLVNAHVGVAEADGEHPNDLAFATTVTVTYPPDQPMGVMNADETTIRKGMLDLFTRAAGGKFYDHTEPRKP